MNSRPSDVSSILAKAVAGDRLTSAEGLELLQSHDLTAHRPGGRMRSRIDCIPEPFRTYNIDRNINYSNVCAAVCDFCAFYRPVGHSEAYVLSEEVLHQKIQETIDLGGDQILMQGGLHPQLPLEWYEDLLRGIKTKFPQVNVHGFSPPELYHFHKISGLPLRIVLERLKTPDWAVCPVEAGRFWSIACAGRSRAARCSRTAGSRSIASGTNWAASVPAR